jgi:hypothetical protein
MEILRNIGQVHIQQLNVQKIVPSAKEYRKIVLSQCSTTLILEVIYSVLFVPNNDKVDIIR